MRYAVLHTIKTPTESHHTLRLIVENVPEKTPTAEVVDALTKAGKAGEFSEGGVSWGNHAIKAETKTGWPKGTEGAESAPAINWNELVEITPEIRRMTLRLEAPDYEAVVLAAKRANKSLQTFAVDALRTAVGIHR